MADAAAKERPLANRALKHALEVHAVVEGMCSKLRQYSDPRTLSDLEPSVELTLRISLQTLKGQLERVNCPGPYIPGQYTPPPPVHIGAGSGAKLTAEAQAKAKAMEERALAGFATTLAPKRGPGRPRKNP